MIFTFVLSLIILIYSVFVIHKKIKDIKRGKLCSCGCEGCSESRNCRTR